MPRPAGPPARRRGTSHEIAVPADPDWAESTASVLRALADRTRLSMLAALHAADQPVCICDFTAAYGLTQPTISHHMGKLRAVGLVESRRQGIWMYYRLRANLSPSVVRVLNAVLEDVPPGP